MAKIIIIGAGLTGLSAAYHLEQRGFYDYTIVEKDSAVGGLCRSVTQDGFTFDYTGHLLHTSDAYFRSLIETIIGLEHLNGITRRSFIFSEDTFTRYPYQINLYGLSPQTITECIEGFANRGIYKKKPKTFHDWALHNFGDGIAKHFFFPFQRKIFSYDLQEVSASWTGRFVPQTSLKEMITGALTDQVDATVGYNSQFLYPKVGGINYWIDKFAKQLSNPIRTNCAVQQIDTQDKRVIYADGSDEQYSTLINTMPLDTLLGMLKEKSTTRLRSAANKLVCNSVVNFNLGFNRPDISDKHWIYFPETKYPFYRVGFPHNFADAMAPDGCSSLYGEFSYIEQSPKKVKQMLEDSLSAIKEVLAVNDADIITRKDIFISHAYVIFNFWRERNLPKLHKRLQDEQIHSVGRYGEWKYSSMQEAVLDGKKIAEQLTVVPAQKIVYQPQPDTHNHHKEL